jgi:hypothetical protein
MNSDVWLCLLYEQWKYCSIVFLKLLLIAGIFVVIRLRQFIGALCNILLLALGLFINQSVVISAIDFATIASPWETLWNLSNNWNSIITLLG